METMFHLRCGMPLWLLSGCLTLWALRSKACDELKLRSVGPHASVSFVSLLCTWPSVWQAYSWPSDFELRSQYRDLMMHWGRLCAREDVRITSAQAGKYL